MNGFSKREAISFGWRHFWFNWLFLGLVTIFVVAFPFIATFIINLLSDELFLFAFVLNLIFWALQLTFSLGLIQIYLAIVDSQPANFAQLFSPYRLVFKYLVVSIISGLITLIGILLLVIPGIIFSLKLQFWPWLMVDRNLGVGDSLRESWQMTKGVKLNLLLFNIILVFLTLIGALIFGIGLLVAIPVTQLATAYVYRQLSPKM